MISVLSLGQTISDIAQKANSGERKSNQTKKSKIGATCERCMWICVIYYTKGMCATLCVPKSRGQTVVWGFQCHTERRWLSSQLKNWYELKNLEFIKRISMIITLKHIIQSNSLDLPIMDGSRLCWNRVQSSVDPRFNFYCWPPLSADLGGWTIVAESTEVSRTYA